MCILHKTGMFKLIHHQFKTNRVCDIGWKFFELLSFSYQCLYFPLSMQHWKFLLLSCFKILCWQCWKTAAVHPRRIMLDDWDEDNELIKMEQPSKLYSGIICHSQILYFKITVAPWRQKIDNLYSKCIAYCRYTGAAPVTWLLLKSE